MQYCSLQHPTLLPSPVTSITDHCFCFGSVSLFFLELFLHCSPVAYWAPTNLGSSSFSVISFCFYILFMGFSKQEYWSGLPFPSTVDHILSKLSTMTHPSWVALQGMAHSFIDRECGMMASPDSMGMSWSKLQEVVKDREAWHTAVYGVAKSRTQLSNWTTVCVHTIYPVYSIEYIYIYTYIYIYIYILYTL